MHLGQKGKDVVALCVTDSTNQRNYLKIENLDVKTIKDYKEVYIYQFLSYSEERGLYIEIKKKEEEVILETTKKGLKIKFIYDNKKIVVKSDQG